MIGSLHEFHDSIYHGRRSSTSVPDGNVRNSIDENSSYDDLMKVSENAFAIVLNKIVF